MTPVRISILVLIALGVSLAEFYFQLGYAYAIGYTSLPFDWDNNRYVDTAWLYLNAIRDHGLQGLLQIYADKPPYSFTLLLTGLPFLALSGQEHSLFTSQLIYVLLMDAGLLFSIWRLTGSLSWAAFGLLTFTSWTSGIVSGVNLNAAMESVKYQLNVPLGALYIALTWMILEALPTSRKKIWGTGLTLILTLGLLLRPPMLPFFLLSFFPLLALVSVFAWRQGIHSIAAWTAFAIGSSSIVTATHYANIWPKLLVYVNRAVSSEHGAAMFSTEKTGLDYIGFYLNTAIDQSPAVIILLAAMLLTIPHSFFIIKNSFYQSPLESRQNQEAIKWVIVWWLLMVTYAVPTVAKTKNPFFGLPFMLVAWVGGTYAIHTIISMIQAAIKPRHITILYGIVTGLATITVSVYLLNSKRDIKWTWEYSHYKEEKYLKRLHGHQLSKAIHQRITRLIYDWATANHLQEVSVGIDDRRQGAYAHPDKHNLRIGLARLSQGTIRLYSSATPKLGIEIECDPRAPSVRRALGMPLDRYWPERAAGKYHGGDYTEIHRSKICNACILALYESKNNGFRNSYEWP